jgi:hypothetical protein
MTGDFSASGSVMDHAGDAMIFGLDVGRGDAMAVFHLARQAGKTGIMQAEMEADVALFDARLRGVPTQGDVIAAHLRVAAGIRRRARTAACRQRPRSLGGRP